MEKTFQICKESELSELSAYLDNAIRSSGKSIVLLHGELGAGKTALVKNFVQKRLSKDASSPTFSLVNVYGKVGEEIYHMDLYRLKSLEEIEDIGIWDYLESGRPVFIEWPDKIADILPEQSTINVHINVHLNGCRDYWVSY